MWRFNGFAYFFLKVCMGHQNMRKRTVKITGMQVNKVAAKPMLQYPKKTALCKNKPNICQILIQLGQ